MKLSKDGYKRNSKDVNNPYNIIPSGDITMKGVDFPVMGTDNLGNQQLMQPGFDYKFPGNMVFEQPVQDKPTNKVKQRRTERDNKLLPNYNKQMGDVSTHLMTTIEMTDDDGSPIYMAIPMLYPTVEGQETPDPTSWTEFQKGEEQDAFKMALERGEVYYFNSAEEADAFAKGGYKTPNLKKRKHGGEDSKDDNDQLGVRNALQAIKPILGKTLSKFLPLVNMFKPLEAGRGSTLSDLHFSNQLPDVVEMDEDDMQVYEILLGKKVPEQGLLFQSPEFDEFSKALILANQANSIENSIAEQYNIPNYQSTGEVDNTEVKDYFTAYLKSPLFKRRAIDLHGEDNWESVRDAKLERLENTEVDFSGEEEWLDIYNQENPTLRDIMYASRRIPEIQSRYKRPNYMDEGNENPIIKVNPGQAITMGEDLNLSYNPFNSIVANEYSHALGASNSLDPFPYRMTDKEIRLSEQRKPNAPYDSHDSRSYEMKSDIDTTRYELWKAGLYNFEEDFMFDQSHIDYIRNNPDKFIKDENLFKQYDDDVIIDQMNIYTDVGTTPFAVGKFGTELPKAQWYNPFDPKYKALYQSAKNLFSPSKNKLNLDYRSTRNPSLFTNRPHDVGVNSPFYKMTDYRKKNWPYANWQDYIKSQQVPLQSNLKSSQIQLPSIINDSELTKIIDNKGDINNNLFLQYLQKIKGLSPQERYDRGKMLGVYETMMQNNRGRGAINYNAFADEVQQSLNPTLLFPTMYTSLQPPSTQFTTYWQGKDKFNIFKGDNPARGNLLLTTIDDAGVTDYSKSIGAGHFGKSLTDKLVLGHNRVAFSDEFPDATISVEKQSDYAQKYNKNLQKKKDYLSKENPINYEGNLRRIESYNNLLNYIDTDDINFIDAMLATEDGMHWSDQYLIGTIRDFIRSSPSIRANAEYRGPNVSDEDYQTSVDISNHNFFKNEEFNSIMRSNVNAPNVSKELQLEIAQHPAFKSFVNSKIKYEENLINESKKRNKEINEQNKKELDELNNPSEVELNLKEFRKNPQQILLSELADYSAKNAREYLHLPLSTTVAKTQGYDADKFGAPNPLYTEYNWTGHSWNDFLNVELENTLGNLYRSSSPGKETLGPFTFDKTNPEKMIVTYKEPDGSITEILGDFQEQKNKIEKIRNEFLTSKGYDPNDVSAISDPSAYPERYQSILNKNTEKQLKKDINKVFGKDYPYEIITDQRGNEYIRVKVPDSYLSKYNLDIESPGMMPIKGKDLYKLGGSLPKAQYKDLFNPAKIKKTIQSVKDTKDYLRSYLPSWLGGTSKNISNVGKGYYNITPGYFQNYHGLTGNTFLDIVDQSKKDLEFFGDDASELTKMIHNEAIGREARGNVNYNAFEDLYGTAEAGTPTTSVFEDLSIVQPLDLKSLMYNPEYISTLGMGQPVLGAGDHLMSVDNMSKNLTGSTSYLNIRNDILERMNTTEGRRRIKENYLGPNASDTDVDKFIETYKQIPIINNSNSSSESPYFFLGKNFEDLEKGILPYVGMNTDAMPENWLRNIFRHEDEHALNYVGKLIRGSNNANLENSIIPIVDDAANIFDQRFGAANRNWFSPNLKFIDNDGITSSALLKNQMLIDDGYSLWGDATQGFGVDKGITQSYMTKPDEIITPKKTNSPAYTKKGTLYTEPTAHVAELQQYLLDNKYISDAYDNITADLISKVRADNAKLLSGTDYDGYVMRILDQTKDTKENNKLIANLLNKMLAGVPITAATLEGLELNNLEEKKTGGSIKDRYKKKLPKFQMQGQNNPGWLANRLYKSVTPIGYNMDQAMVEMLYGERQPFMWDGVKTSFDDFQNHPRFKDNPNFGEYIKKASEDLWGMYLGFDQKHNTVSKSKFKPTLGVEDDKSVYYSFNNVDDIMDDIIERGITKDASKDKWQINDSAAGGFNLNNYQISRGMDDERELPYYAYYDEYDFDIPTGLGFNIEGESIVGKPFNIYGRIYYHPDTKELIPPSELNANWVDFEKLKQGVAYAESLNGELMINPESTATGLYGQRFSEISTMYDGSRQDFANDIEAQNEYFENRYRGKLEGVVGLRQSGIDLYKEYSNQIPNFPYTTTEVAALVNFLGRQGTREYLGYVLRDGNSLESVFPDKYGVNAGQANKTPQEYIEKFNEGITKKQMGGEVDKVTDRLIKKYENGDKLTPAGTKHLKSLGMI